MNSIKKVVEVASMRMSYLSPRQIRYEITRKDWLDFGLVLLISALILVYKVGKASS
jgi:hypothetical protein